METEYVSSQHDFIPIAEFDRLAREGAFAEGPWKSTFGDGWADPYVPQREVWGVLKDGRKVKSLKELP
jgi:hypothetical protein